MNKNQIKTTLAILNNTVQLLNSLLDEADNREIHEEAVIKPVVEQIEKIDEIINEPHFAITETHIPNATISIKPDGLPPLEQFKVSGKYQRIQQMVLSSLYHLKNTSGQTMIKLTDLHAFIERIFHVKVPISTFESACSRMTIAKLTSRPMRGFLSLYEEKTPLPTNEVARNYPIYHVEGSGAPPRTRMVILNLLNYFSKEKNRAFLTRKDIQKYAKSIYNIELSDSAIYTCCTAMRKMNLITSYGTGKIGLPGQIQADPELDLSGTKDDIFLKIILSLESAKNRSVSYNEIMNECAAKLVPALFKNSRLCKSTAPYYLKKLVAAGHLFLGNSLYSSTPSGLARLSKK